MSSKAGHAPTPGRLLIERYGYQATFLITAGIKALSFLPLTLLLPLVPDGMCTGGAGAAQQEAAAAEPAVGAGYAPLPTAAVVPDETQRRSRRRELAEEAKVDGHLGQGYGRDAGRPGRQ